MKFVKLKNITKKFGKSLVLENISMDIIEGEFYMLLGRNGEGKTTLARILAGLEKKYSGQIDLPKDYRIIYLEQDFVVLPFLSALKNIQIGKPRLDKRSLISKLKPWMEGFGVQNYLDKKAGSLSYGQKQAVALLRAIVSDPDLLIIDEAFSHLDTLVKEKFIQSISNYQKQNNVSVLWITHNFQESAQYSHKVSVLSNKKIIQTGTAENIYFNPKDKIIAKLCGECNLLSQEQWQYFKNFLPKKYQIKCPKKSSIMIRPSSIKINEEGDGKFIVKTSKFCALFYEIGIVAKNEIELKCNQQEYFSQKKRVNISLTSPPACCN